MNGRFEEKLARIAFGDASPEEIAKIERRAKRDPAAAKALAEYRMMKSELKKLVDTPAHQLSNERLREAILAQGLHPKPLKEPSSGVAWLWMPVAAALLGVAFVNLRSHRAGASTRIVLGNPDVAMAQKSDLKMPTITLPSNVRVAPARPIRVAMEDSRPLSRPASLDVRSTHGILSRNGHRHSRHRDGNDDLLPTWDAHAMPSSRLIAQQLNPAPIDKPVMDSPKPAAANASLVLIDSDPDSQTGAPGATEVGTASNVVIGG